MTRDAVNNLLHTAAVLLAARLGAAPAGLDERVVQKEIEAAVDRALRLGDAVIVAIERAEKSEDSSG